MGTAHTVVFKEWLDVLKTRPDLITIHREGEFDDGTILCQIESPLLPDGDNGVQVVVCVTRNPLEITFVKDVEV